VIYGLGARFDGNLRKRDLEEDTPYNNLYARRSATTPIALPGQAAIDAAVAPRRRTSSISFAGRRHERIFGEPRRSQSRRGKIPVRTTLSALNRRLAPHPPMLPATGRFITLEGIDGAGQEHACRVYRRAHQCPGPQGRRHAEPGGTALGEKLRLLVLNEPMTRETEALLMFAARREHLELVIRPALARGDWVVCDRFTDATYAYQGGGHGVPFARIRELERWVHEDCQPDVTFPVRCAIGVSRARLDSAELAGRALDKFEREANAFFHAGARRVPRARQGFAGAVRVIDSTRPVEVCAPSSRTTSGPSGCRNDERSARANLSVCHGYRCCRGKHEAARAALARRATWPHALLIYGPQGIGKHALALNFAQALLCETPRTGGLALVSAPVCRYAVAGQHRISCVSNCWSSVDQKQDEIGSRGGSSSVFRARWPTAAFIRSAGAMTDLLVP